MEFTDSSTGLDFWISVAKGEQGEQVVTVIGELDAATSPRMRQVLNEAIDTGEDVEIDLRGCGFVDSSGIAAIVGAAWKLRERGHRLRLLGAQQRVRSILELAGIAGNSAIVLD